MLELADVESPDTVLVYDIRAGERDGPTSDEHEELARPRGENSRLRKDADSPPTPKRSSPC